jgi:hypothetical protein
MEEARALLRQIGVDLEEDFEEDSSDNGITPTCNDDDYRVGSQSTIVSKSSFGSPVKK